MLVEITGTVVERMNHKRTDTRILGNRCGALYGIAQQGGAKMNALGALINRQPSEYKHGNRVGHIAPHGTRRALM